MRIEGQLKALMTRSLAGDAAAHSALLTVLEKYLCGYFRGRLRGDDADVADLAQETLLAISVLAADTRPVSRHALLRRLLIAAGAGSLVTLAAVIAVYGPRHDLGDAVLGTTFWIKAGFTACVGAIGLGIAERAARPGSRLAGRLMLLVLPLAFILTMAWVELAPATPSQRVVLWLGQTWRSCPFSIVALSIPPLTLLLLSLRRLAPTRPAAAGFAAGILSGGLAATAYGLHCPETSAAFIAAWYAIGMLACGLLGAVAGRRLLRW